MKKLTIVLMILVLMFCSALPVSAAQTASVAITPNTPTAHAGSSVTFTVTVTGVTAAKSIGIIPQYDSNVFELVSGQWLLTGAALSDFSGGTATIAYTSEQAFNQNVFYFILKVKNGAALNTTSVSASVSIKNGDETIACYVHAGAVTISCPHNYSQWTSTGDSSHSRTCSLCGNDETLNHAFANACDTSCDDCGYTRTITHTYQTTWSSDANKHWHECSVCKAPTDSANHTPGAAATETTPQVCTVCDYVIQGALGHIHKPKGDWLNNAASHWRECSECEDFADFTAHDYDNDCDTDCSVCGYERTTTHTYDDKWTCDKSGHWHACTVCGEKDSEADHVPGPESTEDTPQTCTVCSYEIAPAKGHTHTYEGDWSHDANNHWQLCSCNTASDHVPHDWDKGTVTKEPTSKESGEKVYTCTTCKCQKSVQFEVAADNGGSWFSAISLVIGIVLGACVGAAAVLLLKKKQPVAK